MSKQLPPSAREFFVNAGKRGARKAKKMFTTEQRRRFGKKGGRPITSRGPDVPCPTCGAQVGEHCKAKGGQVLYTAVHSARRKAGKTAA